MVVCWALLSQLVTSSAELETLWKIVVSILQSPAELAKTLACFSDYWEIPKGKVSPLIPYRWGWMVWIHTVMIRGSSHQFVISTLSQNLTIWKQLIDRKLRQLCHSHRSWAPAKRRGVMAVKGENGRKDATSGKDQKNDWDGCNEWDETRGCMVLLHHFL